MRWLLVFTVFDVALRASAAAGVPTWREWPPGDAHDVGFVCALVIYLLTKRRRAADEPAADAPPEAQP